MSLIPNAKALDPGWVTQPRHLHVDGRHRDRLEHQGLPGGQGPGVVEGLLGRQGVSRVRAASTSSSTTTTRPRCSPPARRATRSIPVTDDKMKLVFDKLREIKPHVKVWWTAGAQPPQLLSSGELALSLGVDRAASSR